MTRERFIFLISHLSFRAGDDLYFADWEVDLKEHFKSACPMAQAIIGYFAGTKQTRPPFLTMKDTFYKNELGIEVNEKCAKELIGILPEPFIKVRIDKVVKGVEAFCGMEGLVVEKRLNLRELLAEEVWSYVGLEPYPNYLSKMFPFPNELRGSPLICRISLGWREPDTVIRMDTGSFLGKLLEEESTMDLVLVAGNRAEVKCHKLIFAAHAPAFSAMVSSRTGMKESRTRRVEMRENSEEGIRQLVRYLYGFPLVAEEMASDGALELFETAHKYGLGHLEQCLMDLLLGKDVGWFTPDGILELYLYVRNLEVFEKLREYSMLLMARMPSQELKDCEEFKKLSKTESIDLTFNLVDYLQTHPIAQPESKKKEGGRGKKRRRRSSSSSSTTDDDEFLYDSDSNSN